MPSSDNWFPKTHGLTDSPEYRSWRAMKERCLNHKRPNFDYYGGRGITVDPLWLNSFETFYRDMGPRPDGCSLDRIDPNKNYTKSNCRWADRNTQAGNRSPHGTHRKTANKRKRARDEIIEILKQRGQWVA